MSLGLPRVLVLTGTSSHPFPRLLDALPALVRDGVASEVRVQSALPVTPSTGIAALGTLSREAVAEELQRADVVIAHGGSGTCLEAIRAGHRPIVVPRRAALGEIVDDHQVDLALQLAAQDLVEHLPEVTDETLARAIRGCPLRQRGRPAVTGGLGERIRALAESHGRPRGEREAPRVRVRQVEPAQFAQRGATLTLASPLQSVAWGEARRLDGWRPRWWLATDDAGRALAAAQTLERSIPGAPLYLPYGPSMVDAPAGVHGGLALLRVLARSPRAGVLWAGAWFHSAELTSRAGGRILDAPSQTGTLDLSLSAADLRRGLRGTWRRELEQSERDSTITVGLEPPAKIIARLLRDVAALASRAGFEPPIAGEVGARFAELATDHSHPRLVASVASAGGIPLATYLVAVCGSVAQTLWTSGSNDPRAGGAGRRALWTAIDRARGLGARTFDLAGIDDAGNPGVASFKRGLRPTLLEVPGMRWIPPAWCPPFLLSALEALVRRAVAGRPRDGGGLARA